MGEERHTTTPKEREHTDPRKQQPRREHDQDSEPWRTAEPPETPENEADWNRQEGC